MLCSEPGVGRGPLDPSARLFPSLTCQDKDGDLEGETIRTLTTLLLVAGSCCFDLASAEKNPERNVYFGEQHVHTSWSFDAYAVGNTMVGPEQFYQYATGKRVEHPGRYKVGITKPLDWAATTEHGQYMGMIQEASDVQAGG
jgi:hypothetical protein